MPCGACGCACSEATREELEAPLLTDIETGSGNITAAAPDGEVDEPTDAEREKGDMIFCCIAQGLLALLWLYLVDVIRRKLPDSDDEYYLSGVFCLVFSAVVVGMLFCEICANISPPRDPSDGRISS